MATGVDNTPQLLRQPLCGRSEVNSESPPLSPDLCTQPVARALAGVIVYVEVRSIDSRENRSNAIASELEALGATVCQKFTKDVTHVVFKDGKSTVRERAEKSRVFLVSPLWVEACKRANDWISEAKYPVISRDTTDASSTPVVLGKIKRIKSMQPKPLEEEIAKSKERSRKRPGRGEGREGEKRRREIIEESSNEMEAEEDNSCTSGFDLPVINLATTPRLPLSDKSPNAAITPFVVVNNIAKNKQTTTTTQNNKQTAENGKQKRDRSKSEQVMETSEEEEFVEEASSKVVSKGNKTNSGGSKVIAKATKSGKPTSSKAKSSSSKGGAIATKNGGKHKSGSRSRKVNAKKPAAKRVSFSVQQTETASDNADTPSTAEPSSKKKRKSRNNSRPSFTRDLPGLVMTSVSRGDQELVLSVVKKLGKFSITDMVEEQTTHLVCGRAKRTINVLSATVRGCWALSLDWVWKSLEAGQWLSEEEFEMIDSFPAAQYFRQERQESGPLFRATLFRQAGSVCVSPTTSPPAHQLEILLVAGGANVTRSLRKADVCVGCHSPREGLEEGAAVCVTVAWILDSISSHRMLPYEGYTLDRPQSKESSPEL